MRFSWLEDVSKLNQLVCGEQSLVPQGSYKTSKTRELRDVSSIDPCADGLRVLMLLASRNMVTRGALVVVDNSGILNITMLRVNINGTLNLTKARISALLSGTLRTYQQAGCDDEVVVLNCPTGTSISIEVAQYGKPAPEESLCKLRSTSSTISRSSYNYNSSCLWPNAIQTVVEACQKKRQCKFQTSPKTFGGDPCPEVRKYVEVAYKCRPYEFRSQVACQNNRIQLKCNPNSRVAVYSASYGRTEYESIQCPQPQGVPEETCLVSYATEIVMQLCHGKRNCDLSADTRTFGSPCKPESRMYLKVVYTCVPRKVLKEQYEGFLEPDETDEKLPNDDESVFEIYDAGNEYIREFAASPSDPNIEGVTKVNFTKKSTQDSSKSLSKNNSRFEFENQERFFLYLIVSVAAAVVLLLSVMVGRLLVQRHRSNQDPKCQATNISDTTFPNGFVDDIDEVDADIDLPTPLPCPMVPSVTVFSSPIGSIAEVVRYPQIGNTNSLGGPNPLGGTLRRPTLMMDRELPATLSNTSNSQYYFG